MKPLPILGCFCKNLIKVQKVRTWFRVPSWYLGVSTLMDLVRKIFFMRYMYVIMPHVERWMIILDVMLSP